MEYESVFKIYGVVLFDLWTANDSSGKYKWNKIVFEKMRAGCFYKEYFEEKEDKKDKREGFEEVAHLIKNAHKNIVGYSYNLGALIFKISNLQQNYESTK